ncbi:MAG: hypothetical protein HY273_07695, partial [Gammaproteobacteria bacterium]|nr:hypothetical protein [Gammaproteobacteria bacterium]
LGAAFERIKSQHIEADAETLLATFRHTASEILHDSSLETHDVLRNLNLLDTTVATLLDKTVALIEAALARFTG